MQVNIQSLEHTKTDKLSTHPALFQNLSILIETIEQLEQNPLKRSPEQLNIYNRTKQILQTF